MLRLSSLVGVALLGAAAFAQAKEPRSNAAANAAPSAVALSWEMQQLLKKHNDNRTAHGLPALTIDSRLQAAAVGHANWMAATRTMSHNETDGSAPLGRAVRQGYKGSSYGVGENIAYGFPSVDAVFAAWLGSAGHLANIKGARWKNIGVAVATASNGARYWCVEFGYVNP